MLPGHVDVVQVPANRMLRTPHASMSQTLTDKIHTVIVRTYEHTMDEYNKKFNMLTHSQPQIDFARNAIPNTCMYIYTCTYALKPAMGSRSGDSSPPSF